MSVHDNAEQPRRQFQAPHTPHHPIPTIRNYQEEKEHRKAEAYNEGNLEIVDEQDGDRSKSHQAKETPREYWQTNVKQDGQQKSGAEAAEQQPEQGPQHQHTEAHNGNDTKLDEDHNGDKDNESDGVEPAVDTSPANPVSLDPEQRRKGTKKRKDERAERQVTDPVTHLPVTIHDFTLSALKDIAENEPPFGATERSATALSNKTKSNKELQRETYEMQGGRESMRALFPPPSFEVIRKELIDINKLGVTIGLVGIAIVLLLALGVERALRLERLPNATAKSESARWYFGLSAWLGLGVFTFGALWALIVGVRDWMAKRIDAVWFETVWEANRESSQQDAKAHETETVAWLNSLIAAVWPLINPDLFTSLADTLEDVMQASLPKIVQMVSVDDIGQGSESIRILGIRWLPTGAAAHSVASDGKLKSANESKQQNDRAVPGEGEVDDQADDKGNKERGHEKTEKQDDGTEKGVTEGMEAEEGDFINMEVAFAYRARSEMTMFKDRLKDMHLYLAFYLPANIKLPVWVDLRGIVGTMRMRLQLTPDPPFFALCTLTFLGQPKIDVSAVPLVKGGLNIMNLPLISNFVQSSIDAAMAQYVAPKSLTIDLKDMIAGEDFKKDTNSRGVLVVTIKRGLDFKTGDPAIPLIKPASADPYVSLGFAKFGKPVWSTRVLLNEMEPSWNETAYILITPDELNVDERLRVQLWDSDRFSADDDLGRIERDVKQLMKDPESNGKMCDRTDGFRTLKAGEDIPGKLVWSVGYFPKTRIQPSQLKAQTFDPNVRDMEQLKMTVDEVCERKLREAYIKEGSHSKNEKEFETQKVQEMKSRQDAMINSAPPPGGYPSGIFSIQIHQITGLELEKLSKDANDKDAEANDEAETGEDLPSAYCQVILNHSKIFKTRTKPKNAKPFYNAGVERFVGDWRTAEVYVAVRDARVNEDDPLLGIVYLPLSEVFKEHSQVSNFYPLMGGVGFGRIRLSTVWRSVQLQAPPQALGWEYGTFEVDSGISMSELPRDLCRGNKLKFYTSISSGKMYADIDEGGWLTKNQKSLKLAVRKRYSSCVAIYLRTHGPLKNRTLAFATLWLHNIPDEEECQMTLPVWKGDHKRASANDLENCGEKVGSIVIKCSFWSGLGGAHSKWASKDSNVRDIIEVLDTARDNYESHEAAKEAGVVEEDDFGGDDDEDSSEGEDVNDKMQKPLRPDGDIHTTDGVDKGEDEDEDDANGRTQPNSEQKSKTNIFDSAMEYKRHMKSEHRRNRGLMQWKVPRNIQWAFHRAERAEEKVASVFKHGNRKPGIETEV